jgi:hypothetical protein
MSITRIKDALSNDVGSHDPTDLTQASPVYQVLTALEGLDIHAG